MRAWNGAVGSGDLYKAELKKHDLPMVATVASGVLLSEGNIVTINVDSPALATATRCGVTAHVISHFEVDSCSSPPPCRSAIP